MLGLINGMSHRKRVKKAGKLRGKNAKGKEGKRKGKKRKPLFSDRRGNKIVMTINESKGSQTTFRNCSVPYPIFLLMINDLNQWLKDEIQVFSFYQEGKEIGCKYVLEP